MLNARWRHCAAVLSVMAMVALSGCGGSSGSTPTTGSGSAEAVGGVPLNSTSPDGTKSVIVTTRFVSTSGVTSSGFSDFNIQFPGSSNLVHLPTGGYGTRAIRGNEPVIWSPNSDQIAYLVPTDTKPPVTSYQFQFYTFTDNSLKNGNTAFYPGTPPYPYYIPVKGNYSFTGFTADGSAFLFSGTNTDGMTGTHHYSVNTTTGLITILD